MLLIFSQLMWICGVLFWGAADKSTKFFIVNKWEATDNFQEDKKD